MVRAQPTVPEGAVVWDSSGHRVGGVAGALCSGTRKTSAGGPTRLCSSGQGRCLGQGSELIPVPAVWQLPSPSGESPQSPPTHTGMQSAAYLGILVGKNDKGITEGPLSWGTQSTLDT